MIMFNLKQVLKVFLISHVKILRQKSQIFDNYEFNMQTWL